MIIQWMLPNGTGIWRSLLHSTSVLEAPWGENKLESIDECNISYLNRENKIWAWKIYPEQSKKKFKQNDGMCKNSEMYILHVSIDKIIIFLYISYKEKRLTLAQSCWDKNLKAFIWWSAFTRGPWHGGAHHISRENRLVVCILSVFFCVCPPSKTISIHSYYLQMYLILITSQKPHFCSTL